jgi:hypothetical protein
MKWSFATVTHMSKGTMTDAKNMFHFLGIASKSRLDDAVLQYDQQQNFRSPLHGSRIVVAMMLHDFNQHLTNSLPSDAPSSLIWPPHATHNATQSVMFLLTNHRTQ